METGPWGLFGWRGTEEQEVFAYSFCVRRVSGVGLAVVRGSETAAPNNLMPAQASRKMSSKEVARYAHLCSPLWTSCGKMLSKPPVLDKPHLEQLDVILSSYKLRARQRAEP